MSVPRTSSDSKFNTFYWGPVESAPPVIDVSPTAAEAAPTPTPAVDQEEMHLQLETLMEALGGQTPAQTQAPAQETNVPGPNTTTSAAPPAESGPGPPATTASAPSAPSTLPSTPSSSSPTPAPTLSTPTVPSRPVPKGLIIGASLGGILTLFGLLGLLLLLRRRRLRRKKTCIDKSLISHPFAPTPQEPNSDSSSGSGSSISSRRFSRDSKSAMLARTEKERERDSYTSSLPPYAQGSVVVDIAAPANARTAAQRVVSSVYGRFAHARDTVGGFGARNDGDPTLKYLSQVGNPYASSYAESENEKAIPAPAGGYLRPPRTLLAGSRRSSMLSNRRFEVDRKARDTDTVSRASEWRFDVDAGVGSSASVGSSVGARAQYPIALRAGEVNTMREAETWEEQRRGIFERGA